MENTTAREERKEENTVAMEGRRGFGRQRGRSGRRGRDLVGRGKDKGGFLRGKGGEGLRFGRHAEGKSKRSIRAVSVGRWGMIGVMVGLFASVPEENQRHRDVGFHVSSYDEPTRKTFFASVLLWNRRERYWALLDSKQIIQLWAPQNWTFRVGCFEKPT